MHENTQLPCLLAAGAAPDAVYVVTQVGPRDAPRGYSSGRWAGGGGGLRGGRDEDVEETVEGLEDVLTV